MLCCMRLLEAPSELLGTSFLCDPRGCRSLSRVAGSSKACRPITWSDAHSFNVSRASTALLKPLGQLGNPLLYIWVLTTAGPLIVW